MDMERYGDYTEYEDDIPKSKNPIVLLLKIAIGLVVFSVIGILVFRMIFFRYYPDSITNIYFTDELLEYYREDPDSFYAETQELRAPYDNPDVASFICDNLIVVRDAGHLQVSARFNKSLLEDISKKYKDVGDISFTFRLVRNPETENSLPSVIGTHTGTVVESNFLYTYYKLAFDGIDFGLDEGESKVNWIRLEIYINGVEMESPYMVAVYENNESYARFSEYEISKGEIPK